jgi:hypothetical protein
MSGPGKFPRVEGVNSEHPPIPSRHGLWLRLRGYLILFDPLTFVLDQ